MIRLKGIEKSFGACAVLRGVDLTVETGKVVAVLGPSGSGKSTLLRSINHLEKPSKGIIEINDFTFDAQTATSADIAKLRGCSAMVFQQFNLFHNLTVLDNVMIGLTDVKKLNKKQARAQSEQLLQKVGLLDKSKSYPSQISGGQQQRAAIARALALKPEVLLFDEPTSALDPELVEDVLQCIKDVAREGNTMILVTHELGFAYDVADTVVLLDEGVVVEEGPAKAFFHCPQTERAKLFLGKARNRFILACDEPVPFREVSDGASI